MCRSSSAERRTSFLTGPSPRAVDRRCEHPEHSVRRAHAVDDRQTTLTLVVLDQRCGLLLVEIESVLDCLRCVVVAMHDVAAAHLADPRQLLVSTGDVVGTAVAADPPGAEPCKYEFPRHVEIEDEVDRPFGGDLVECLRLEDRAREAVEDVAATLGVVVP